jgi:hypothetical protein
LNVQGNKRRGNGKKTQRDKVILSALNVLMGKASVSEKVKRTRPSKTLPTGQRPHSHFLSHHLITKKEKIETDGGRRGNENRDAEAESYDGWINESLTAI